MSTIMQPTNGWQHDQERVERTLVVVHDRVVLLHTQASLHSEDGFQVSYLGFARRLLGYSELVDTIREIKDKYYDNLDGLIMTRLDGVSEAQVVETLKLRKDAFLRE